MGDRIEIYPCHGAGSACGRSIGDRKQSTIGNERIFSEAFQERTEQEFVDWILRGMPEAPTYYFHLKNINAKGAPLKGCVPTLQPLSPSEFQQKIEKSLPIKIIVNNLAEYSGSHTHEVQ